MEKFSEVKLEELMKVEVEEVEGEAEVEVKVGDGVEVHKIYLLSEDQN